MGYSKTGYQQVDTLTPEQMSSLRQMLQQGGQNTQAAAEGYKQFLPGGTGNNAITAAANQNFQQVTQPGIINALGSNAKSSSALNQALAGGAANLNTNLGAVMAQNQLQASQGLGALGSTQQGQGLNREAFALKKASPPLWESILGSVAGIGGKFFGLG
jgi:hypothetical protein